MDSALNIAAVMDQNTNITGPSEPQGEIVLRPNVSSTSEDEEPIIDAISSSSLDVRPDLPSTSWLEGSHIDHVDKQSTSVLDNDNDYVRNYRDEWGILDQLNVTLGTSHTLDTPSVLPLLKEYIEKNYDFGTVYGHLCTVWNTHRNSNKQDELCRCEKEDREMRQRALVGNRIVNPRLVPRCVWDLYSNHVVPYWIAGELPIPISHAWVDEEDHVDMWMPINGKEWPVPILKDANLDLIRIEMLNLDVEYTWLDVLCLRQKGGPREDLRKEEWKLDELGDPRIIARETTNGLMCAVPIDYHRNYETDMLTKFHKQLKSFHTNHDIFSLLTAMWDRVSTNPMDRVAGLALPMGPRVIPAYYESRSLEDAWTALYPGVGLRCKKWRPTWEQVMTEPLPAHGHYFSEVQHADEMDEDWVVGLCIEKGLLQGLDAESAHGVN
ncbi:hypothetical protein EV421DRAFT_1745550 [Armillaria borealis]|uniref:Heterokaryon incompatibility domain-containing protein n=1 Tax=Armillaria borealis TaxID=47425 RepID=A0AA39IS85_9AGAR|nr:hypothetical protein EV421DRAFT_1745550 [Armillaria borealis]